MLLWTLKGELLALCLGRLNVLLNQIQELVSEVFIYPFAGFSLVEGLVAGLPLCRATFDEL